jgi:glycosyltransferase involved in cell wall biosynthesis
MFPKSKKRIAILVPTYNCSTTLETTLKSLQGQSCLLQYIQAVYIADDCSQDQTTKLAQAIWKAEVPLKLLKSNKNLGERGNVNRALETIGHSIDWVLILHSDDIANPNWLDLMASRIESCSDNVGSICSSWDNLMVDGSVIPGEDNLDRPIEVIQGNDESLKSTLVRGCWWHISGCAIRMKTFEDIGSFNVVLPQLGDWEWLLRCLHHGWAVEYIPRTLILYRQHSASVSSESYRTHRDITESLGIVRQYSHLLSTQEYLNFHSTKMNYLIRRAGRSLLQFKIKQFSLALTVMLDVLGNVVKPSQLERNL